LAHRAAEVQVEVVDAVLADHEPHRLADVVRIDAVELQAARRLLVAEAREEERLAVALDERPRGDHLAHVEPGPEAPAERPEGRVRDPGHGREDDGRPHPKRADADGRELAGRRARNVAIPGAAVDGIHDRRVKYPTR